MNRLAIIGVLLVVSWGLSAQTAVPPVGKGTKVDPYQLSTLENLFWLSQNDSVWACSFVQTADIDAKPTAYWYPDGEGRCRGFLPIGNGSQPFSGSYNGKGYAIRFLHINSLGTDTAGLFGCIKSASVDSLELRNVSLKGVAFTGCIAGMALSSTISDCAVSGIVEGTKQLGGLLGACDSSNVTRSCFSGEINGTEMWKSSENVGGLCGYATNSTIDKGYFSGFLYGSYKSGGLVGSGTKLQLENCYTTGIIMGYTVMGGLVGYFTEGLISSCYNGGGVTSGKGSNFSGYPAGTLVGELSASATVINCYWKKESFYYPSAIGYGGNYDGVGMSLSQLTDSASFVGFDFALIWDIRKGTTSPYLRGLDNAPFALRDEFISCPDEFDTALLRDSLLVNDCDPDTPTDSKVVRWNYASTLYGNQLVVPYQLGEIMGQDTVWSSSSIAVFPYQNKEFYLSTYEDLKKIGSERYKQYTLEATYHLQQDIDARASLAENQGAGFMPIGSEKTPFLGEFRGHGHRIVNLTMNWPGTDCVGFIGYSSNLIIDSLGLENTMVLGYKNVGSLLGYAMLADISASYCTGSTSGFENVGALMGCSDGCTLTSCFSSGSVSGKYAVGGLVGNLLCGSRLSDCYNTATVSGQHYVGGLVGINSSSLVLRCFSAAVIDNNSIARVKGSFIGYNKLLENIIINSLWCPAVVDCYVDAERNGNMPWVGQDENNQSTFVLNTSQLKQRKTFANWNFMSIWGNREGLTYPALLDVSNNAPFAFPDRLVSSKSIELARVLENDVDFETLQTRLTYKVLSCTNRFGRVYQSDTGVDAFVFDEGLSDGIADTLVYRVGEIRAESDTLWGNQATALVVYSLSNGVLETTSTNNSLQLFPNLCTDQFVIKGFDGQASLSLFDLNGRQKLNCQINDGSVVRVSHLTSGVYLVRIQFNELMGKAPTVLRLIKR